MKFWRAVSGWMRSHAFLVDTTGAVLLFALASLDVSTTTAVEPERGADALAYLLLAGQALPLAYRRRLPLGSMYVVVFSLGVYWIFRYAQGADASAVIAIYSAAAYGSPRRRTWIHFAIAAGIMSALTVIAVLLAEESVDPLIILGVAAVHVSAALLGQIVYQRRQRIADLEDRAARAEEELETRAQLAVLDERTRIAREMHDVVSHSMSVMVVQAAGARRVVRTSPEQAEEALQNIETIGRESLGEMRRMLGVLRSEGDNDGGLAPQPTMEQIPVLVAHSSEAGVATSLTVTGTPVGLPAGLQVVAYRVIQEALTNVIKHGGRPVNAEVEIDYSSDLLSVSVIDDGRGAAALPVPGDSEGHGIMGMRERVELYSGEVHSGPKSGGGFEVRALIPLASITSAGIEGQESAS